MLADDRAFTHLNDMTNEAALIGRAAEDHSTGSEAATAACVSNSVADMLYGPFSNGAQWLKGCAWAQAIPETLRRFGL